MKGPYCILRGRKHDVPKGYTNIPPPYLCGTGMYKPVFDKNKLEWRETQPRNISIVCSLILGQALLTYEK